MFLIITEIFSGSQFWATLLGIIFAAVIGNVYWNWQHKKQLKRDFELDFFQRVNDAITELMFALGTVQLDCYMIIGFIKFYNKPPEKFNYDLSEEYRKIINNQNALKSKVALFFSQVQGYEMIIYKFIHYRKFLSFRIEEIDNLAYNCMSELVNPNINLNTEAGFKQFEEKCNLLRDKYIAYLCYLQDYRNELMEYFLKDLFKSKIPERVAINPVFSSLKKVATKEAVEKEERQKEEVLRKDIVRP